MGYLRCDTIVRTRSFCGRCYPRELGLVVFSPHRSVKQSGLDRGQVTGIRQGDGKGGEEKEVGVNHQGSQIQKMLRINRHKSEKMWLIKNHY